MYNFELVSVLVAFFDDYKITQKENLISDLKSQIFNNKGNSTLLPVPDGQDKGIPRLILSQSGEFEVTFSEERINYFNYAPDIENPDEFLEKIYNFSDFLDQRGYLSKTKRVGVMFTYLDTNVSDENRNRIFRKLLNTNEELSEVENSFFELRRVLESNHEFTQDSIDVNKIFKVDSTVKNNDTDKRLFRLETDLNTFPNTKKINVDTEFVREISRASHEHSNYVIEQINTTEHEEPV